MTRVFTVFMSISLPRLMIYWLYSISVMFFIFCVTVFLHNNKFVIVCVCVCVHLFIYIFVCVFVCVCVCGRVCAEVKEVYDYVYLLFVILYASVKKVFTQKLPEILSAISNI